MSLPARTSCFPTGLAAVPQVRGVERQAKEMTEKEKSKDKLKPATDLQKDVARKTEELKNLPLPESKDLKEALPKLWIETGSWRGGGCGYF